jgi:hypothetical protein
MVYQKNFANLDGTMDTTLGLIMRLNYLWTDAQNCANAGEYSKWNFVLDSIWRNLTYRDPITIIREKNDNGEDTEKIINAELSDDDKKIWSILNSKLRIAQCNLRKASNKEEKDKATYYLYQALQLKDVGLRKFQHKLHLYVKEKSKNPSNAMWGG